VISLHEWIVGLGVIGIGFLLAATVPTHTWSRAAVAVVVALVLAYFCVRAPREGLLALLGWLVVLALVRRLVTEYLPDPRRDPLLLVAPFVAGLLCVLSLLDGAARRRGWVANGVIALSIVTIVATPNPEQSSWRVGAAGLIIWLVPMLYFWVGRRYLDGRLAARLVDLAGGACIVAAAYGVVQSLVDFPSWDRHWIQDRGYTALVLGRNTYRPFSSFSSAGELAIVCAFGCLWALLLLVRAVRRREPLVAIGALGAGSVAGLGLLLVTVRMTMVFLVISLFVVYLVWRRRSPWVPVGIAIVGLMLAVAVAQLIDVDALPTSGAGTSVRRTVVLLQDPFGDRFESTGDSHVEQARRGIEAGFRRPLGGGPGTTNRAADQYGGASGVIKAELDIPNAGVAFGIIGMVLVTGLTVAVLVVAIRAARRRPDLPHLAALGLLVISLGHWWNGGHYLASALLWLLIGWLDAPASFRAARVRTDAGV
jgi:hypothetical protein